MNALYEKKIFFFFFRCHPIIYPPFGIRVRLWQYTYSIVLLRFLNWCTIHKHVMGERKKKKKKESGVKVGLLSPQNVNFCLCTNHSNLSLKISELNSPTLDTYEFMLAGPVHWLAGSLSDQLWPVVRKAESRSTVSSSPHDNLPLSHPVWDASILSFAAKQKYTPSWHFSTYDVTLQYNCIYEVYSVQI